MLSSERGHGHLMVVKGGSLPALWLTYARCRDVGAVRRGGGRGEAPVRSVSDGWSGRGRDHPVAAVLALAAAAVAAGMKGNTAIAGWVRDVPPPVLTGLYLRAGAAPAGSRS